MYSVYVLKIDPPTTFKIFPKIDLLMSCSLCPQSLGHENISLHFLANNIGYVTHH